MLGALVSDRTRNLTYDILRGSDNLLRRPGTSTVYVKQDQRHGSSLPSPRMRLEVQSRIRATSLVENRGQSGLYDARDLELKLSWAVHPERCEEWRNRGSEDSLHFRRHTGQGEYRRGGLFHPHSWGCANRIRQGRGPSGKCSHLRPILRELGPALESAIVLFHEP